MKITLELQDEIYTVESKPAKSILAVTDDYDAGELIEKFSRMLVLAGFYPDVIVPDCGGHYETTYKEDNEETNES